MASDTPSEQVRIPVGDLIIYPSPTHAQTILLGEKLSGGGRIIIRRQNDYKGVSAEGSRGGRERERTAEKQHGRAQVGHKFDLFFKKNLTVPKSVTQCRKYPMSLRYHPYTSTKYLHCRPILRRTYLNTLPNLYPI